MSKSFYKIKRGANLEPQVAAPDDPENGDLYFNIQDGLLIRKDGAWVAPGAGSGSGELNLIDNPNDGNQNWFISASGTGDIAFATTNVASENPLEGIIATAIKVTASTSGTKFLYTRFKVPDTLLTAKLKFEWYQKLLSGFVDGEWRVELWWNTMSDYTGTYTEIPLRNDDGFDHSVIPAQTARYINQWNGTTPAQYLELRIYRASGSGAASWSFTNAIAGPGTNSIDQSDLSPAMAGFIIPYSGPLTSFQPIGSDGTTLLVKNGWALCNGASISQSMYSQLFANLGTTWNTAAKQDGLGGNYAAPSAGFFRIPDLRGIFIRGVGTSVRANGAASVAKALAQFNDDTTAVNGLTVGSTTTINNTDLSHTHAATGLTVSGTNSNSSLSGGTAASAGAHTHSVSGSIVDTSAAIALSGGSPNGTAPSFNNVNRGNVNGTYISILVAGNITGTAASSGAHTHTVTGTALAQAWSGTVGGSTAGASVSMNHAHTASTTSTPTSTDTDTAPRSQGLNYLVKLYDAQALTPINTQAVSPFRAGFISAGAQSVAPQGWLECGGQAVSRNTYSELFANIGTQYGAGDGSTTFNVPDLRGRVIAGKDDMGGVAAGRITNAISGIVGTTLGAAGGSQSLQAHTHAATGLTVSGTNQNSSLSGGTAAAAGAHTHSVSASGTAASSGAHQHGFSVKSGAANNGSGGVKGTAEANDVGSQFTGSGGAHTHSVSVSGSASSAGAHTHSVTGTALAQSWSGSIGGSTNSTGAGGSQNVQPTLILNFYIKAFNDSIDVFGFNAASYTTTGLVTNSDQTFGGVKSFPDGIIAPTISAGPPNVFTSSGTVTGGVNLINSAANTTISLSTAVGQDGKQVIIKNIGAGIATLDPNGTETIDGDLTTTLSQYNAITLLAYAGNWYII